MSTLLHYSSERMEEFAKLAFDKQFKNDPKLNKEYDSRRKRLMYQDILYNLGYLEIAMEFEDDKIFKDYAIWIYQLLYHLMKDLSRDRIKEHMVLHYEMLKEVFLNHASAEEAEKACYHLDNAISVTIDEALKERDSNPSSEKELEDIRKEYLDMLLKGDSKAAIEKIIDTSKSGVAIENIYVDVLQETMVDVGELWHKNKITIDKEHYCTITTQMAMSQFYPAIYSKPRNGFKLLACAVGSELHEMGIRMISDLFELKGWDSIYLGAAVPKEAILNSIEENKPDLVTLSVTMPLHLQMCFEIVKAIRERFKDIKIAVGGRAFLTTDRLWEKWDVDIYTEDAIQLYGWADKTIVKQKRSGI